MKKLVVHIPGRIQMTFINVHAITSFGNEARLTFTVVPRTKQKNVESAEKRHVTN